MIEKEHVDEMLEILKKGSVIIAEGKKCGAIRRHHEMYLAFIKRNIKRRTDILITTGKEVSQWSVFLLLFYQGH